MELSQAINGSLADLLRPEGFTCGCGKVHKTQVKTVKIGPGMLAELPGMARELGMNTPALVADRNTWKAAGEKAFGLMRAAGFSPAICLLDTDRPEPDEYWLGSLAMRWLPDYDGVIAVGSGAINDLCKMLSGIAKLPYIITATAPSMDGFASTSGSMMLGGLKCSIPSKCPDAVLADTEILAFAPKRMLQAGLGDMLAKYISVCEWRISHAVNGEYYCPEVAGLIRSSLRQCVESANGLMRREQEAAGKVVSGLILSGMAMSMAGVTRPASGIEHYFSHVWEMEAALHGGKTDLHGIQVGVGVMLAMRVFDRLKTIRPDATKAAAYWNNFNAEIWRERVVRVLGFRPEATSRLLPWVLAGEQRVRAIISRWDTIMRIISEELPDHENLETLYKQTGIPASPEDIGISSDRVRESFLVTKDVREKYVVSTLLSDLGLLEEFATALF